jgi:hypothetical protein
MCPVKFIQLSIEPVKHKAGVYGMIGKSGFALRDRDKILDLQFLIAYNLY